MRRSIQRHLGPFGGPRGQVRETAGEVGNIDKHETGKQEVEQFVTKVVRSMKQDDLVGVFLW
jgi:hypothetical protein